MSDNVLDADKLRIVALQSGLVRRGGFFLAGGTGLGLRLGHRLSRDIDWFTPRQFDAAELAAQLLALANCSDGL